MENKEHRYRHWRAVESWNIIYVLVWCTMEVSLCLICYVRVLYFNLITSHGKTTCIFPILNYKYLHHTTISIKSSQETSDTNKKLGELQESRAQLLQRVHNLKKDLQDWRGKLDGQVKSYRTVCQKEEVRSWPMWLWRIWRDCRGGRSSHELTRDCYVFYSIVFVTVYNLLYYNRS